jgi:predicted nucleotidyltransferase
MAESNWRAYFSGDEVRVKKYLYVLRPLLAARWIEQARSLPPVLFDSLVAIVGDLGPLFDEIASLLALKAVTSEVGSGPRRPVLDAFAESEMRRLAELRLPSAPPIEFEELDAFFRRWLERSR